MTYEEFVDMLEEPIGGKHNFNTETANLAFFCYELSLKVEILKEKNIELEKQIRELKRFVRRNVEPDFTHMI